MQQSLESLVDRLEKMSSSALDERDAAQLAATLEELRRESSQSLAAESLSTADAARLVAVHRRLPESGPLRGAMLRVLATAGNRASLEAFALLAVEAPPDDPLDAALAFAALLQHRDLPAAALFPQLLDAIASPQLAASVLDVANHSVRRGLLATHPARERVAALSSLLGHLVERLRQLEERPPRDAAELRAQQDKVNETLSLVISLCDALALIGDSQAIGKLHQAMSLRHRRLRTEAASALARLDDAAGERTLVELAADPAARTRALAYLNELGKEDVAAEEHRTPAARAEGELAQWLADPLRFGLAPQVVETVDSCRQHWPGYRDPVDCHLVSFEYHLPQGEISGVGIVGPVVHCFAADLQDLPPSDIYAAYAGWHAEHEELQETEPAAMSAEDRQDWIEVQSRLAAEGCQIPKLAKLCHFFGRPVWVLTTVRDNQPQALVVDGDEIHSFAIGANSRPLGPNEAYCIFKGRQFLTQFNRE